MHKNETLLTPLFRLILSVIESNGMTDCLKSCDELRKIREHLEIDNIEIGVKNQATYLHIIDLAVTLLEKTSNGDTNIGEFWKDSYQQILSDGCDGCYSCRKCKEYFWLELGEIFCGIENPEKEKGIYFPVRKVPEQIQKCLEPSLSIPELYGKYAKTNRSSEGDLFVVLKGMSSSTPAMMNSLYDTTAFSGGGFYLRCNGLGIAIDPGYHFVHNLQHYGYSILDVDIVIVTHEHIDHNNDMRLFDDLSSSVSRSKDEKMVWILDKVSYQMAKIFQENGTGFDAEYNELYMVNPEENQCVAKNDGKVLEILLSKYRVEIDYFPTRHIQDKKRKCYKTHTFGCSFRSVDDDVKISYTSDTSYYPELVDYIGTCDVLIANISGIYEEDFMLVKGKERHLGYYGCYHLLREGYKRFNRYPKLVLLSEFWNGKHDIRYDVVERLKLQMQETGIGEVNIVPAELGMVFNPKNQYVRCSACGRMVKNYIVLRPVEFNGRIQCFCDRCYFRN